MPYLVHPRYLQHRGDVQQAVHRQPVRPRIGYLVYVPESAERVMAQSYVGHGTIKCWPLYDDVRSLYTNMLVIVQHHVKQVATSRLARKQ